MWVKAIRSRSKKDLHAVDQPMSKKPKKNLFAKVFRVTKVLNAFKAKKRIQESEHQQLLSVPSSKDSEIFCNMYHQPSQLDYLSPNLKCNKFSKVNHWKKMNLIGLGLHFFHSFAPVVDRALIHLTFFTYPFAQKRRKS